MSQEQFPLVLVELLIKETPLLYRKKKRRAIIGLEVAEEKERDASRQRRREEREVAASAIVNMEAEAREERKMIEAE